MSEHSEKGSESNSDSLIVIKRVKKNKQVHHGGAWKIAYADFITAMMAFFMLMWLISLLNKYELEGLAEYFSKPLVKARSEASQKEKDESPSEQSLDDTQSSEELKKNLEDALTQNEETQQFSDQLNLKVVEDGLKVDLHDLENKAMFPLGKAKFNPDAKRIIRWLSEELKKTSHKLVIIGHTDTYQYQSHGRYTNWELSADRANAMRKLLIQYGVSPDKILRIQGAADTNLLDYRKGDNPINRRIEMIILTPEAAKKLMN